jgi:TolA-binding protein
MAGLMKTVQRFLVAMCVVAGCAASAAAQEVKQIKLTDQQVKSFIAAQADLAAIASKIQSAGEKPDPALQAELEAIAKKHGFNDFAELDDVAANISIVMAGLDSQTGNFVDPVEALQKELEDVKKDESIPEADKKQLVDELTEAIKTTPPLQNKENIDIVKTHRADIEKALQ